MGLQPMYMDLCWGVTGHVVWPGEATYVTSFEKKEETRRHALF
jgi:hypothetical protein